MALTQRRSNTARMVLSLSLIAIVARLMGFAREQIIAAHFGASAVTDAFLVAQIVPTWFETVVGSAVAAVLVPMFSEAVSSGERAEHRLFVSSSLFMGLFYGALSLGLWVAAPGLAHTLAPGLEPVAQLAAVSFIRIQSASIVPLGLSLMWTSLFHVHQRFMLPSLAAVSSNLLVIAVSILYREKLTLTLIACVMVTGVITQAVLLIWPFRLEGLRRGGWSIDFSLIARTVRLSWPLVLGNASGTVVGLSERFFASHLRAGSLSALSYAGKLLLLPVGVLVLGLSSVLFTRFSAMASTGDLDGITVEFQRVMRGLLFLLLPATALLILFAKPLVFITFHRGQFDLLAVESTSEALAFYSTGFAAMAALPVLNKVLTALQNTRAQLASGIASAVVYIGCAPFLSNTLEHRGLALAFALSQIAALLVVLAALVRALGVTVIKALGSTLPTTAGATLAAAILAVGARSMMNGPAAQVLAGCGVGILTYLVGHYVVSSQESQWLWTGLCSARSRFWERGYGACFETTNRIDESKAGDS